MDKLHVSDVEAAGAAGVSLKNITLHRGPDGALLDGYFLRDAEDRWTYTGGLRTGDEVAQVAGLRMSPWAGTALDEVLRRVQAEEMWEAVERAYLNAARIVEASGGEGEDDMTERTDQTMEHYRKELRDDVQTWIESIQREQAKKRKRSGDTLVVPPELPEGIFRIAWVTDVVFDGNHHIPSPRYLRLVDRPAASFLIHPRTIASFDFSEMTRLVVAAHEAAVRVEIGVGGFRELELFLYARQRQGGMSERHPDLDTAVGQIRAGRWSRCPFPVPAGKAEG